MCVIISLVLFIAGCLFGSGADDADANDGADDGADDGAASASASACAAIAVLSTAARVSLSILSPLLFDNWAQPLTDGSMESTILQQMTAFLAAPRLRRRSSSNSDVAALKVIESVLGFVKTLASTRPPLFFQVRRRREAFDDSKSKS